MQRRSSSKEILVEFDYNPLCRDIEDEDLKSILRLLLKRWSSVTSWNNPLWISEHCKFMLNHGLNHIKNVFRYASRLYYVIQRERKDFLKEDKDKFRLIMSTWLHDWGHAILLGNFSELSEFLRKEGGYKPELKKTEIDDTWVRKNHSLISCFNILNRYRLIDEKRLMDEVKELKILRDDIAALCCYHTMSTPLTRKQKNSKKYEIKIRSLEERNSSLLGLCALLRILDSCDETWYRVADDFWEYEKWENELRANEVIGEIENALHEQKKDDVAKKLLKILHSGKINDALVICENIGTENDILAENLKEKVKEYEKHLGAFFKHTESKAYIWDAFFNFKDNETVEIILFPFGFRYYLTETKRKFLEETVIERISKEIEDSKDCLMKELGLSFTVRLAKPEDDPEKLEVPEIISPASERLINELKGELLRESLFFSSASQEDIFDFYCGAPLSWKIIAANGEIRRDQEQEMMDQALQGSDNFQIVCVVAEPGAGKTTVAWRVAYELFRRKEIVLHFYNDNPDVWYKLSQLVNHIDRNFYLLVDDVFRNREFAKVLQKFPKDGLPVTVLATSRSAEYREAGFGQFIKKIQLKLSEKEKKALLDRLGKSYEELPRSVQHTFHETDLFLVLGMVLTKGKHFERIIREIIESLLEGDKRYHDALHKAYEYVCFSNSYGISIPEELLSNLDPREGRFDNILQKERSRGVFYEDPRPQYPTIFIRAGHQLIAEKALELYTRVFGGSSPEVLFREILEATDEQDWIQRAFIAYLARAILEKKEREKNIENIIVENEKVSCLLQNATISELGIWKSIYSMLNRKEEVKKCSRGILSGDPNTTLDCQLLISELLNYGLIEKVFQVTSVWLEEHPDDGAVFSRYISLVREKGDEKLIEDTIGNASEWLRDYPENKNVREALLILIKEKGSQEQIRKVIDETVLWLGEHPKDNKVREAYLVLVRERGDQLQVEKAIDETVSWLKDHAEDKKIRPVYLSLVRDRAFINLEDIKQALDEAERWMEKYGPNPLFKDYLALVKKVRKSEIGIVTNVELIKQLGYKSISSCEWKNNITLVDRFARWLSWEKFYDESEKVYIDLSKVEIRSKKVKADVCFGHGMLFISQAMNQKLTREEHLEKLERAEEKIREALRNVKGHIARAYLAISLREQKRFEESEKEFKHVEWWARNVPTVGYSAGKLFFEIGKFYLEFGRHKEARYWFEKAIREEPENFANRWGLARAKMGLAVVLKKQEMSVEAKKLFSEALLELEKAIEKAPKPLQLPASRDIPDQISKCKRAISDP